MDAVNRSFVGIRIPLPLIDRMQEGIMMLKRKPGVNDVRWNAPSEYLITLGNLGELSLMTLTQLKQVLPPVIARYPCLRLSIQGFGGLPNMIQPRYAYANLAGDTEMLCDIAHAVDRAAAPYAQNRDQKPFHPHILIGRLKTESEPLRVALGRALKMNEQPAMGDFEVTGVELLTSHADTSGVGYSVFAQMRLGAVA